MIKVKEYKEKLSYEKEYLNTGGDDGYGDSRYNNPSHAEESYGYGYPEETGDTYVESNHADYTNDSNISVDIIEKVKVLSNLCDTITGNIPIGNSTIRSTVGENTYVEYSVLDGKSSFKIVYDSSDNKVYSGNIFTTTVDAITSALYNNMLNVIEMFGDESVTFDTGAFGSCTVVRNYEEQYDFLEYKPSRSNMNMTIKCEGLKVSSPEKYSSNKNEYSDKY